MRYGRRAYGAHRKMSDATIARTIAGSITTHKAQGIERKIEEYTHSDEMKQRVEQLLAA